MPTMKALRIQGPARLDGTIAASGAKNAALPMLAAALLADGPVVLQRVPTLADITAMLSLLELLGVSAVREADRVTLTAAAPPAPPTAPYELVRTMRASVLVLGPLLARHGEAVVSLPGGCAIGARPIDQHIKGLAALGAQIEVREGYVHARAEQLRGARISFDMPTVTGTENVLMAAVLARGDSVLENAACEPEIRALCTLLRAMGAEIDGDGTPTIRVHGVERLGGAAATVITDRIEVGTYLMAAAATRGRVTVEDAVAADLDAALAKLEAVGCRIDRDAQGVALDARNTQLRPADVRTSPFPGFPTDLQAQWMALMATVPGAAEIEETIFENRFMHVPELARMGADIRVRGNVALVRGGTQLSGAPVMATDLRASAGLVVAGLAAHGTTDVLRIYHLERGYENLCGKLRALGADVITYERDATVAQIPQVPA